MKGFQTVDGNESTESKTSIVISSDGNDEIERLKQSAVEFASQSKSEATKKSYRSDWRLFEQWCGTLSLTPLPATAETIVLWCAALAETHTVSSISRKLTTISQAHKLAGYQSPTTHPLVGECLKGIRRKLGTSQRRAKPLVLADLKRAMDQTGVSFRGKRDAALLALGWAAALRRSELVELDVADLEFRPEGLVVHIRSSKTDQHGEGYTIGIPLGRDPKYCPTKRVETWINISRITSGPLFFPIGAMRGRWFWVNSPEKPRLGDQSVSRIVKKYVELAGISPAGYSGHSLRAGFITSAAAVKIPEYQIQLHTRHRSSRAMRGYIRDGNLFSENSLNLLI